MRIVDQGIIFDATQEPAPRRFNCFTSTTVLSDGHILVAFRAGSSKDSPDENVIMRLSGDEGHTWETVYEGLPYELDGRRGAWRHGAVTELAPGHLIATSAGSTAPTQRSPWPIRRPRASSTRASC